MTINGLNVLLLSAGRRVELIRCLKSALIRCEIQAQVHALDLDPYMSAACHAADGSAAIVRATDGSYVDEVLQYCKANSVGLVIPTIDTELMVLANARQRFHSCGITAVISHADFVRRCRDKRLTGRLFEQISIEYPRIFGKDDLTFPCFCKPFAGSRSVGARLLRDACDLRAEDLASDELMFMEYIPMNYSEYTIDAYYSSGGRLLCLVPRERLEVRDGEISKGIARKNFVYEKLWGSMGHLVGAVGCITLQVFADPETHDIKGLEINPRFGGGYPLSDAAGARYAEWLIREYLLGETLQPFEAWDDGTLMLRYDAAIFSHVRQI